MLIRVGADLSSGGGFWNGPVDSESHAFAYVSIPEYEKTHQGLERPYAALTPSLTKFGVSLPGNLGSAHMHLDPDFSHLTYGDSGRKAKQIKNTLHPDDYAVFYAGLRDIRGGPRLVYAIIGMFEVQSIVAATDVPLEKRDFNAHSRRILPPDSADVIVIGKPGSSGRLASCVSIGEYRERAYRVRSELLDRWGGLSVKNGYLQRSAQIPHFLEPRRFLEWLQQQSPVLVASNN